MFECSDDGSRLSDETYLCGGISEVGPEAARSLLKTIKQAQWTSWFGDVFPELAAAHAALSRLREAGAPSGFLDYDRIVVDEVQDLTLLETAVLLRLCRALATQRSHAPWLLMAFDDGQTVRPSGFNTGRLNDLLGRWLAKPAEFGLEYNVRSPSAIADVVRRA